MGATCSESPVGIFGGGDSFEKASTLLLSEDAAGTTPHVGLLFTLSKIASKKFWNFFEAILERTTLGIFSVSGERRG